MKNIFLLTVLALLISSCSDSKKANITDSKFDLYGTSQIMLINTTDDSIHIEIANYPVILGGVEEFDTILNIGDTVKYQLKTQGYSYFTYTINEVYHKVFTAPKSKIKGEIITDSLVNYVGNFDSINNYLAKSSGSYYSTYSAEAELANLKEDPSLTYTQLTSENDNIIKKYRKIISQNKAELPHWYLELENKRLLVLGAHYKLNSLSYRKRMMGLEDEIPLHYVDSIVKNVPFQDERLMGFSTFCMLMFDYSAQSFNPLNDTSANSLGKRYSDSLFAHTAKFVPKPLSNYSLASSLSRRLMLRPDGFKPEWIELISDTVYKSFLRKRLNGGGVLPKGAKAPNFTVLDIDSNHYHFSGIKDTKDTVVLINFWASYCKPCIDIFKHENELVERFKNKPVKIINLCIETDFWRFTMLIEQNQLTTLNLFANKKTSSQLRERFDIFGIPHSLLIDKNGLVVKNKCSVRGDGIVADIEALLY